MKQFLNIEINKGNNGAPSLNSPSIDRIDNKLGYTKDNIRIISYKANTLKNDSSIEEYTNIFNFYKNLLTSKREESVYLLQQKLKLQEK